MLNSNTCKSLRETVHSDLVICKIFVFYIQQDIEPAGGISYSGKLEDSLFNHDGLTKFHSLVLNIHGPVFSTKFNYSSVWPLKALYWIYQIFELVTTWVTYHIIVAILLTHVALMPTCQARNYGCKWVQVRDLHKHMVYHKSHKMKWNSEWIKLGWLHAMFMWTPYSSYQICQVYLL